MNLNLLDEHERRFVAKLILPKMLDLLPKLEHECRALKTCQCPIVGILGETVFFDNSIDGAFSCLESCKANKKMKIQRLTDQYHHRYLGGIPLEIIEQFRGLDPQRFDDLFTSLKIKHKAKKYLEQLEKARSKAKAKQACTFTVTQQRKIARMIFKSITSKNLLLSLAQGIVPRDFDKSGKALFDSLNMFNISKKRFLDALLNHKSSLDFQKKDAADIRRWALAFSDQDKLTTGMIDEDPLVRELAKQKYKEMND